MEDVTKFLTSIQARRDVSIEVMTDIIKYMRGNAEAFSKFLQEGSIPSFRTMRDTALRDIPNVKLDVRCTDPATDEIISWNKVARFPRKEIR